MNAFSPAKGGAKPAATLRASGILLAVPTDNDFNIEDADSGSTPTTLHVGFFNLMADATPARRPPPPQQTTTISTSGTSFNISKPRLPCPAIRFMSSNG